MIVICQVADMNKDKVYIFFLMYMYIAPTPPQSHRPCGRPRAARRRLWPFAAPASPIPPQGLRTAPSPKVYMYTNQDCNSMWTIYCHRYIHIYMYVHVFILYTYTCCCMVIIYLLNVYVVYIYTYIYFMIRYLPNIGVR